MKLKEYAEQHDGYIDIDVYDEEIDMGVAFIWDSNEENKSDPYYQFLTILAENVEITYEDPLGDSLTCDFSGYFKQFNAELKSLVDIGEFITIEFDGDETYYDFVLCLPSYISGGVHNGAYKQLVAVFNGEI